MINPLFIKKIRSFQDIDEVALLDEAGQPLSLISGLPTDVNSGGALSVTVNWSNTSAATCQAINMTNGGDYFDISEDGTSLIAKMDMGLSVVNGNSVELNDTGKPGDIRVVIKVNGSEMINLGIVAVSTLTSVVSPAFITVKKGDVVTGYPGIMIAGTNISASQTTQTILFIPVLG